MNSPSCWDFHPVHYLGGHFKVADETRVRSGTSVMYTSILGLLNFAPTLVGHCVRSADLDLLYSCKCTCRHISTCISYLSQCIPNFTSPRRLIFSRIYTPPYWDCWTATPRLMEHSIKRIDMDPLLNYFLKIFMSLNRRNLSACNIA